MVHLKWHYLVQRLKMWVILFVLPSVVYFVASLTVLHFRHETLWQFAPIWARALGTAVFILLILLLFISLNNIKTEEEMEKKDYLDAADGLKKIISESNPDICELRVEHHINNYQHRRFILDLLDHEELKNLEPIGME